MCAVSVNTFVRAYQAPPGSTAKEAGNYKNKPLTKNTKIFLGLISFGLLYGLVELVEHFANVRPKIREFAKLNCDLYNAIVNRGPEQTHFTVRTESGKELTFYIYQNAVCVVCSEGGESLQVRSFEELLSRIHTDVVNNPGYYDGLQLIPTVGSTMYCASEAGDLAGNQKVLQAIKTALYTVRMPGTKKEYLEILADKFEALIGAELISRAVSTVTDKDLLNDSGKHEEQVNHVDFTAVFAVFANAAFPDG